jgi:hypothetical protein
MKRITLLFLAALIHTATFGQGLESLKPSVVRITSKPDGARQTGTGFIVKLEPGIAYILTAYHVVAGDSAPQVEFFSRRNRPVKADIIKLQPDKRDGLGLLAVRGKDNLPADLTPLPIDIDPKIASGDALHTIGFGAGQGEWAVVPASILAIDGSDLKLDGRFKSGNSGGPVLKDGKVVGILTDEQDGVGLASLASIVRIVLHGWGVDPPVPVANQNTAAVAPKSRELVESQANALDAITKALEEKVTKPIERSTAAISAEKPGAVANAAATNRINLLSPRNGGRLLVAPKEGWKWYADDSEQGVFATLDEEGVWGFKDGGSALLESFAILIPATETNNVREVELFYSNDGPDGKFESLGRYNTRNVLMVETPYQEFKFAPVSAKFFKVRLLSSHKNDGRTAVVHEFRLFGTLQ